MKKNTFILMAMTTIFGLSSCDKELFPTENTNKTFTLFATTETGTKTALSGNDTNGYQVFWEEDDQFYVYELVQSMDQKTLSPIYMCQRVEEPFELISGAGTTSGTFKRVGDALPDLTIMALYPDFPEVFPAYNYINGFYPTEQTYSEGNIKGFPMIAQIVVNNGEITGPISFKNMNGILRLTVKGTATVKSIKVSAAELPTPITLDCGDGVELTSEGIDFHIAMPSCDGIIEEESSNDELASYSNVSIYLTDMNGNICCKSLKSGVKLDIARSQITKATFSVNSKDFYSYTTGSKVKIHGHEGIVVEINDKKVIVATMNVGATAVNGTGCGGSSLSFADACDSITDGTWSGWRLPDVDELTTLCDFYYPTWGDTMEGEGKGALLWYIDDKDGIDLYLPLNDYDGSNPYDRYWTGTPGENDTEKCFYFAPELNYESGGWESYDYRPVEYEWRDGKPYKEEAAKSSEFLVRLFHDLP